MRKSAASKRWWSVIVACMVLAVGWTVTELAFAQVQMDCTQDWGVECCMKCMGTNWGGFCVDDQFTGGYVCFQFIGEGGKNNGCIAQSSGCYQNP